MAGGGYVKLYRSAIDSEFYKDGNTWRVLIHLMLITSWEDNRYQGVEIPRGSAVCSYGSIARDIDLSYDKVRTSMDKLKNSGKITITRHSKFLVVSLQNYGKYQDETQSNPNHIPIISQSFPDHIPILKNNKNKRSKETKLYKGNEGASYDIDKAVADASVRVPEVKKRSKE